MLKFKFLHHIPVTSLFTVAFLLFTSCGAHLKNLNNNKTYSFDVQAHRGGRGWLPENTIPTMLHAVDLGVTTLEMDAIITADRQVVVSHEPFFNHEIATKPNGNPVTASEERNLNIYQMPYDSVRQYDVGKRGNPRFLQQQKIAVAKPRLSDLVDSVESYLKQRKKKPVSYNIEIKSTPATDDIYHPKVPVYVELVMQVIKGKGLENRVIIQSFDERALQYMHTAYPGVQTAFLIEEADPRTLAKQLEELGFAPLVYSPYYKRVTPLMVQQCADLHMRLIPWTVNSKADFQRLKEMGVNGIITDYPPAGN
jgi:glycerophosphoryl diester phosphodiesterase